MFAVDLHTHTRFFHGFTDLGRRFDPVGARLLDAMARFRGLDGVAVTNHDYHRDLPIGGDGLVAIPGIEVTTNRGHMLIIGPDPPASVEAGAITPEEAIEYAHDRNCVAIIAHPFRNSTVRAVDADFDAVEVNGKGTESHDWVRQFASERGYPLVGGSDAHYPVEAARAFTLVDADELTPESVVEAIRNGQVSARIDKRPSQRVLRGVYRFIHGQKGWIDHPDREPPGIGSPPGEPESRS